MLVSGADGDSFAQQVEDAIGFLETHSPALAAVRSAGDFEAAEPASWECWQMKKREGRRR